MYSVLKEAWLKKEKKQNTAKGMKGSAI